MPSSPVQKARAAAPTAPAETASATANPSGAAPFLGALGRGCKLLLVLRHSSDLERLAGSGGLRFLAARYELKIALCADATMPNATTTLFHGSDTFVVARWATPAHDDIRVHDYLPVTWADRLDRLRFLRRVFGRAFAFIRYHSVLRGLKSGSRRREQPGGDDPRQVLGRERPDFLLLPPNLPVDVAARLCRAAIDTRTPFAASVDLGPISLRQLTDRIEPVARRVRRRERQSGYESISDLYGARHVLAAYCRTERSEVRIPGYWMHGWIPAFHSVHPAFVALQKRPGRRKHQRRQFDFEALQLVGREDQARYLRDAGFQRVFSIGVPFVYLPPSIVPRVPGSLLVMPPHSQDGRTADDPLVRDYAAAIAAITKNFSRVVLCVSNDDYIKGHWWPAFRDLGIENIVGAEALDRDALPRMRDVFAAFEFVTTNGYGSHIVYAAYCGAKVSVFGPFAEQNRATMRRAHAVRLFPELLETQIALCSEAALARHYPELFVDPGDARAREEWAARELGRENRLAPSAIRDLLTRAELSRGAVR